MRRSPTGKTTTRTTPSATWACLPESKKAYDEASLIPLAKDLKRPLLLVHGTADDNVYYRHTLKLADALFRAGKDFETLRAAGRDAHVHGRPGGDGAPVGEDRGVLQDASGGAEVSVAPTGQHSLRKGEIRCAGTVERAAIRVRAE